MPSFCTLNQRRPGELVSLFLYLFLMPKPPVLTILSNLQYPLIICGVNNYLTIITDPNFSSSFLTPKITSAALGDGQKFESASRASNWCKNQLQGSNIGVGAKKMAEGHYFKGIATAVEIESETA